MWAFGAPAMAARSVAILGAPAWAVGLARRLEDLGVRVVLVDSSPQRTLAARMERAFVHVCEPLAVDPQALTLALAVDLVITAGPTGGQAALQARHFARALGARRVRCAEAAIAFGPRDLLGPARTCARISGAWDLGWRFTTIDGANRKALRDALAERAAVLGAVETARGFHPNPRARAGAGAHRTPGRALIVYRPSAGLRP
jgi:hypothetical protein